MSKIWREPSGWTSITRPSESGEFRPALEIRERPVGQFATADLWRLTAWSAL
jgi:hypothetical protein